MHHYAAPGPIGVSCHPGPRHRPELVQRQFASRTGTLDATGGKFFTASAFESLGGTAGGHTRLMRSQQHVHDMHVETAQMYHQRALTSAIMGNYPDRQMGGTAYKAMMRHSFSSPLLAAGKSSARPDRSP
mmetsp:Transcript_108269/g.311938  ORF Transcript_108269/g.311938 Transcript_108269/m.311938 type:complete len:130 (+) Transcript_108269:117-506(+)